IGHPWLPSTATANHLSAAVAFLVTLYFWRRNTRGIHESSEDALRIMYVTTVMVVLLIGWCTMTILMNPSMQRLPPSPSTQHLVFNPDAVGWMPKLLPNAFVPAKTEVPPADVPAAAAEPRFKI